MIFKVWLEVPPVGDSTTYTICFMRLRVPHVGDSSESHRIIFVAYWSPIGCPYVPHGLPVGIDCCPMIPPRVAHRLTMDNSWVSHWSPMGHRWMARGYMVLSHVSPMSCTLIFYEFGCPTDLPSFMGLSWVFHGSYVSPMDNPWVTHRSSVCWPWVTHGGYGSRMGRSFVSP